MTRSKAKPKKPTAKKKTAQRSTAAAAFKLNDGPAGLTFDSSVSSTVVLPVLLDLIDPSPFNPRSKIDEGELEELAASIAEHGLLQPLVARIAAGDRYELIAGHRRLAALKLNDATVAPCIIRSISDVGTVRALQIIENLQRVDIDPMDEAGAFVSLQAEDPERWTAAAIAKAIGKSDRFVSQRMQLARNLAPELQERVKAGTLKIEVARTLATAPASMQLAVASNTWAIQDAGTTRQQLKSMSVPVDAAAFILPLYTGDYILDDGKRYFVDIEQFQRLQQEAAHAKVDELRKDGWPNAKLVPSHDLWNYRWADTGEQVYPHDHERQVGDAAEGVDREAITALVFILNNRNVRVVKGVIPAAARSDGRDDDDDDADDAGSGLTHEEERAEVEAVNAALAERLAARPDLGRRLFVYSTLGHINDIDYAGDSYGALAPWREQLEALIGSDDETYDYSPKDQADDVLWTWLVAQDDATIDAMSARLMAASVRMPAYGVSSGLERSLAAALDVPIPAFLLPAPTAESNEHGLGPDTDGGPKPRLRAAGRRRGGDRRTGGRMTRRNHTPIYPAAEPTRVKRRRMAESIRRHVTNTGSVTQGQLRLEGFSQAEIDAWFDAALRQSGVTRLQDTL